MSLVASLYLVTTNFVVTTMALTGTTGYSDVMSSAWECVAMDGQHVQHGDNFVPGPDYCTVCKCEEGKARFCRAVLCQPPQHCKSFRVGASCCDFICLDDMLPKLPEEGGNSFPPSDLGLRMVASAVTAILSLALLLFLIHRLRQRRLRAQQQMYEAELDSPSGHLENCHNANCCHNTAYCTGTDQVDLFFDGHAPPYPFWKPPSYFAPHEAPPPYTEAVIGSYQLTQQGINTLGRTTAITPILNGTPTPREATALLHARPPVGISPVEDEPPPSYSSQPEVGIPPAGASSDTLAGADEMDQLEEPPEGDPKDEVPAVVRLRPKDRTSPRRPTGGSVEGESEWRHSELADFQLRLSLDISPSSSSTDPPTQSYSSSSQDSSSGDTHARAETQA